MTPAARYRRDQRHKLARYSLRPGPSGECFANAFAAAFACPQLSYSEGFLVTGGRILFHAFLTDVETGECIEPTIRLYPDDNDRYVGRRFKTSELKDIDGDSAAAATFATQSTFGELSQLLVENDITDAILTTHQLNFAQNTAVDGSIEIVSLDTIDLSERVCFADRRLKEQRGPAWEYWWARPSQIRVKS